MTQWAQLEADFARYYQTELPVALWGREPLSVRRFGVLVGQLPADSATVRTIAPEARWGDLEELMATTVEVIDAGNRLFYSAHTERATAPLEPIVIRRPWRKDEEREKPVMATSEEMVAFFRRTRKVG